MSPTANAAIGAGAVAVDEAKLVGVTQRLRRLISKMDSEARDWLQRHLSLLQTAYPGRLSTLLEAVQNYDFELAVERLDTANSARKGPR